MCASSTTVNTRTETSQLHSEVDLPHSGAGYHLECETSRISPHLSVYTPTDWLQEPYSPIVAFLLSSSSYGIWVSQFFFFFSPRHARTVLPAIKTHKVHMPKSKSGFIHTGHMHITPHWQHDPHIKHQSVVIKPRSETWLTFHAKLSVRGMNAHLCSYGACAWRETSVEHISQRADWSRLSYDSRLAYGISQ